MDKTYFEMAERIQKQEPVEMALIIWAHGSAPRGAGAVMGTFTDGVFAGTVGGGAVEYRSQQLSAEAIPKKRSFVQDFTLAPGEAADLGMVCGGDVTILFQYYDGIDEKTRILFQTMEQLEEEGKNFWLAIDYRAENDSDTYIVTSDGLPAAGTTENYSEQLKEKVASMLGTEPLLQKEGEAFLYVQPLTHRGVVYVFGGGHVAQKLVPDLRRVSFDCIVTDDREEFSNPKVFPDAKQTIVAKFDDVFGQLTINENDYIVIMTRGHMHDYEVLVEALRTPAQYIGMIGSRSKISATYTRLITEEGFTYGDTQRVHSPIGLHLGGGSPAEIAVSVTAQMIRARAGILD